MFSLPESVLLIILILAGFLAGCFLKLRWKVFFSVIYLIWVCYQLVFKREGYNFEGLGEWIITLLLLYSFVTVWFVTGGIWLFKKIKKKT